MSTSGEYSSLFSFARNRPFPTLYESNKTPVTVDVLEVGWIVAFVTFYLCFLIILPAVPAKQRWLYFVKVTLAILLGLIVMMVNFGQEWEVGEVSSNMAYKAGTGTEINATVGIRLGLRALNVTLRATEEPREDLSGETINYNERFYFTGSQGRFGFGQFAGQFNRDFRAAQIKGVPYPILWVAEYFVFDGEGLRYGRNYRLAGFYAGICIWTAFPVWILTIILFRLVISYGAIMLSFLGILLLLASLIWAFRRNFLELAIHFAEGTLTTHFGYHWYLSLIVGILCIISGLVIWLLDKRYHGVLCHIVNIDPFNILEEEHEERYEEFTTAAGDEIPMKDFSQKPKKLQRTVTFKGKGSTGVVRNFTTTQTVEEYPEDYNAMDADAVYGTDNQGSLYPGVSPEEQSYQNVFSQYDNPSTHNQYDMPVHQYPMANSGELYGGQMDPNMMQEGYDGPYNAGHPDMQQYHMNQYAQQQGQFADPVQMQNYDEDQAIVNEGYAVPPRPPRNF